MNIFEMTKGWKTYIAAAGLLGLAVYQASQKDYTAAYTSFMAALAAAGLRSAITTAATPKAEPVLPPSHPAKRKRPVTAPTATSLKPPTGRTGNPL